VSDLLPALVCSGGMVLACLLVALATGCTRERLAPKPGPACPRCGGGRTEAFPTWPDESGQGYGCLSCAFQWYQHDERG
jgi:hypothetical protein